MNFKTIDDLNKLIFEKISIIPNDVDLVVGIPRSGLLVANLISLYLNLPLTDIDSLLNEKMFNCGTTKKRSNWIEEISDARKILVVEDSSISGNSLNKLRKTLENFKYKDRILVLTIYVTEETKSLTDLFFEVCNPPRIFEWNYLHTKGLEKACFDIDGVLCDDPTEEQNDDGEKYIEFIRNAPVKVVPTFAIGWLVTSRLEKYRNDTEYWLNKNGIKYNKLIMMNFKTKEERIASGSHGSFKGNNFKKIKDAQLFIESEYNQAVEIAKISGKTVFCTENCKVIDANSKIRIRNDLRYRIIRYLRKIKKILANKKRG